MDIHFSIFIEYGQLPYVANDTIHNITTDLIHVIIELNAKWKLRHFGDAKIYIKRKMVQKRRRNDKSR